MKAFLLFGTLLLAACGRGPIVTDCISSPREDLFRCHNGGNNQALQLKPAQITNWLCFSPKDVDGYLKACKARRKPPVVDPCIVGTPSENYQFFCAEKVIPFLETENFVCFSQADFTAIETFCFEERNK